VPFETSVIIGIRRVINKLPLIWLRVTGLRCLAGMFEVTKDTPKTLIQKQCEGWGY
jgi:hypothetical protein